jgi:hypothetical protein
METKEKYISRVDNLVFISYDGNNRFFFAETTLKMFKNLNVLLLLIFVLICKSNKRIRIFYGQFLTRKTTRWTNLTFTTGNGLEIFFFLSVRFRNCISFTIPAITLLSSTKQNIQVFKHLKSSFGKIKRLLPSYEMNVKLSTLEMYFSFVSMYLLLFKFN